MVQSDSTKKLVILYGIGGLSDVGRHAVLAALEQDSVSEITVITEYPELLDEKNWKCGCSEHSNPCKTHEDCVKVVPVDSWDNPHSNLAQHFQGCDAVISCLGHRQPGLFDPVLRNKGIVAHAGNMQVIEAMKEAKVDRAVVLSSVGIQEDWPPFEFHWGGKIMGFLFQTNSKRAFKDLNDTEIAYTASPLDYLFVRPGGLGEDVKPSASWALQDKKYEGSVGANMAKMDCARFMVHEALTPTRHKSAVVIGASEWEN